MGLTAIDRTEATSCASGQSISVQDMRSGPEFEHSFCGFGFYYRVVGVVSLLQDLRADNLSKGFDWQLDLSSDSLFSFSDCYIEYRDHVN